MTASESFTVAVVAATELHDLRRRVLRGGDPGAPVVDARDDEESSLHFGGYLDGRLVVVGSFYPSDSPVNPDLVTYQLRYLATDFDVQGRGLGSTFMRAAETRLASRGAEQLWANGRDSALEFYRRTGWRTIEDSQHLSVETGLPHTVIYKVLRRSDPVTLSWAGVGDATELAQLRDEMHFSISLRSYEREWIENSVGYFRDGIGDGSMIVAVARTSGAEIAACAAATFRRIGPSPRYSLGLSAYVHSVSTRPGFRRRGISRELMKMLIEELRVRGIERVELHATDQGENVYRELGFAEHTHGIEMRRELRDENISDTKG